MVDGGEIAMQNLQGPGIRDDVVHHEQESMSAAPQVQEGCPKKRAGSQIKRAARLLGRVTRRIRVPFVRRQERKVNDLQNCARRRRNYLHRAAVNLTKNSS